MGISGGRGEMESAYGGEGRGVRFCTLLVAVLKEGQKGKEESIVI